MLGQGRGVQSSGGWTADWYLVIGYYQLKPNLGLLGVTINYSKIIIWRPGPVKATYLPIASSRAINGID